MKGVTQVVEERDVLAALRGVLDPELGVNVVDLGLIYGVEVRDDTVVVTMTVTAPGCPLQDVLPRWVREAAERLPGVRQARVELAFDPPWTPERMSAAARAELGL